MILSGSRHWGPEHWVVLVKHQGRCAMTEGMLGSSLPPPGPAGKLPPDPERGQPGGMAGGSNVKLLPSLLLQLSLGFLFHCFQKFFFIFIYLSIAFFFF